MKKILLLAGLLTCLVMAVLTLSSCGFTASGGLEIESIKAEYLKDGSGATRITIKYFDDMEKPLVFDIPMGLQGKQGEVGEEGNGIAGIELVYGEDGVTKTMVISFTDPEMKDFSVSVKDGVSVLSAVRRDVEEPVLGEDGAPVLGENGETVMETVSYMVLALSDGTEQKVRMPEGVRGVGLSTNIRQDMDPATGETIVQFFLETGEELTPIRIKPGARGKSINRVETEDWIENEEKLGITLHFYLENTEEPLASVNIREGKDGAGIGEIKSEPIMMHDKKVGTRFYFEKTDGTTTDGIDVMDGVGVLDIVPEPQSDGSVKVTVLLTDGSSTDFVIPAAVGIASIDADVIQPPSPNAGDLVITIQKTEGEPMSWTVKKAVGITNVEVIQNPNDETQYLMVVTYSDPEMPQQLIPFDKPVAWHHGNGSPVTKPQDDYNIGDYYFDFSGHKIYYNDKEDGWQMIVDMNTYDDPAEITFSIKSTENETWSKVTDVYTFTKLNKGSVFAGSGYFIPVPSKTPTDAQKAEGITGYRFLGWCTSREPNGTNGFFTDLTVIPGNIELFPVWEPIYG